MNEPGIVVVTATLLRAEADQYRDDPPRPSELGFAIAYRGWQWGFMLLGIALVMWAVTITWPGWSIPTLLLGSAMVAFAIYGLLVENHDGR